VKTSTPQLRQSLSIPLKEVNKEVTPEIEGNKLWHYVRIGPFGLATRLGISQTEAKALIARYFERFPKVNQYIIDYAGEGEAKWLCVHPPRKAAIPLGRQQQKISMSGAMPSVRQSHAYPGIGRRHDQDRNDKNPQRFAG